MNVLLDMNISPSWVEFFVHHGINAAHWATIGSPTANDNEILGFAKEHGYVVFTHDLDFGAILAATNTESPSVIQLRTQDTMPSTHGGLVLSVVSQCKDEIESGVLIIIDPVRVRIRTLPLNS